MKRAITVLAAVTMSAGVAFGQAEKTKPSTPAPAAKPAAQPSEADMMKAYMEAATPGKEHQLLQRGVGTWDGKMKHWMAPDAPPMESNCVSTITSMMDGRFTKCEVQGDPMPGMPGPFKGFGIYGFDNTSKKYQSTWVDNMGTCMGTGIGEASADGKSITWTVTYNDPITKGPTTMREVDRYIDENHSVLEMYMKGPDGREFKTMELSFTRKGTAAPAAKPAPTPAK